MSDFSKFRLVSSVDIGDWETILQLSYAPDGRRLVAACVSGVAKVFESATRRLLFTLNARALLVWRAVWSPCGRTIAVGTTSGVIVLFDALIGAELRRWNAGSMVYFIAFSPCGTRLVSSDATLPVRVWCPATARLVCEITEENNDSVISASFLRGDGDASLSVISISESARVSINSASDGSLLRRLELGAGDVITMALSPSGSHIAVHFHNRTARAFSVADGSEVARLELGGGVTSVAWASDSVVIVGGDQGAIAFFDVTRNAELNRVQLPSRNLIVAVAARPDGCQVIATCEGINLHVLAGE